MEVDLKKRMCEQLSHTMLFSIHARAANAIVADVAPYRISAEALISINTFLDEFLYFVIDSARSLDLVKIKQSISQVLPTTLGKNAIQEAELELKTYVESGNSDSTQEKTIEITPFPLQKVFEQFRANCQFFSTLGERGIDERDSKMAPNLYANEGIHIAPSLAIYLTAVLEYVGEHVLILVAKATEKHGTSVAKMKEVYTALVEDNQIRAVFRQTSLKVDLEEKLQIKSPASPISPKYANSESIKSPHDDETLLRSPTTPNNGRPLSDGVAQNSKNSSPRSPDGDSLEYNMRSTRSMQSLQYSSEKDDMRCQSRTGDYAEKARNFENLIENNQTVKISLTPNRIKTIEATEIRTAKKPKKQESLYEFLKNTDPDDIFGDSKIRKKDSKVDLIQRRGKDISRLNSVPELPTKPSSNKPKYIPLIPPGTDISSITSTTSQPEYSKNNKSMNQTYYNNDAASKSTSHLQNGKKPTPIKLKPRPEPLYLNDDEDLFFTDGQKRPRRRQTQDLIDFFNSEVPPDVLPSTNNPSPESGKKSEKKFKRFFSKLMKQPSNEDIDNFNQRPAKTPNTPNSYISTTSTLVNSKPQPKYVKIQIPQMPAKETQEQSIYDQVQIQGRHARHTSRNSLGSALTQSPNKSMFSMTEKSQIQLEQQKDVVKPSPKQPTTPISSDNNYNLQSNKAQLEQEKNLVKKSNDQPKRSKTPTPSDNNNNLQSNKAQPEQKNLIKKSDDQPKRPKTTTPSDNNNNLQSNKSQPEQMNLVKKSDDQPKRPKTPTLSDNNNNLQSNKSQPEQKNLVKKSNDQPKRPKTPTPSDNSNNLHPNKTQPKQRNSLVKKSNDQPKRPKTPTPSDNNNLQSNKAQPEQQKNLVEKSDNFIEELIYAEISLEQVSSETKESKPIIIIEEIDESEEALIVEWLIGTGLAFKQARPIVQEEPLISDVDLPIENRIVTC
ncbi:22305_t:CDS:2 [Cetraspora pellucida]|uniref:22305_t:CDS:1 n=1 Tax=Cetraspora pellucida TaxID=1433469 RepID=A0A9N9B9M0_9GLOM|nr:22305_t:CDS:2 [Cetraspora pellucida]